MEGKAALWLLFFFAVSDGFLLDTMTSMMQNAVSGQHAAATSDGSSSNKLGSYNVQTSAISVSGLSAGGAMAVQFHVAYSSEIMGMASMAGIAYHCSQGQLTTALTTCMSTPSGVNPSALVSYAKSQASTGSIDNTTNIGNDKIFIWTGTNDGTVHPESADKIDEFYSSFSSPSNIKLIKESGAAHTFPTDDYGNLCSQSVSPYISNCNYNGAYELLKYIYGGNLKKPNVSTTEKGKFLSFDQTEFIHSKRRRYLLGSSVGGFDVNKYVQGVLNTYLPGGSGSGSGSSGSGSGSSGSGTGSSGNNWQNLLPGMGGSLPGLGGSLPGLGGSLPGLGGSLPGLGGTGGSDDIDSSGFVYIPSGCINRENTSGCKLHVAFHGCKQGRNAVGDTFAKHAGYNKVGELNDIIILYPQVTSSMMSNPNGCWDWWGYSGPNYDNKQGVQMRAVKKMIDRITGFTSDQQLRLFMEVVYSIRTIESKQKSCLTS